MGFGLEFGLFFLLGRVCPLSLPQFQDGASRRLPAVCGAKDGSNSRASVRSASVYESQSMVTCYHLVQIYLSNIYEIGKIAEK